MSLLVKSLVEFFDILKKSGMDISIQDSKAAIEALQFIDISQKAQFRAAMATCLVKKPTDRDIFARAFELFFTLPEARESYIKEKIEVLENRRRYVEEKARKLCFKDTEIELTDEYKEIYASLPEEEMTSIKDFLDATSSGLNVRSDFKQLAETMVKSRLNSLKQKYRSRVSDMEGALSYEGTEAFIYADEVLKDIRENQGLLLKNIGDMTEEDIPKAVKLMMIIIAKLRKELSRRYGKTGKRRILDLKRTIRSNAGTGQVLFKLKFKSKRRIRNKLLLFCDVSASMTRFSGFAARFMLGLGKNSSSTISYVFADNAERINLSGIKSIIDFFESDSVSTIRGRGTNIGNSLKQLQRDRFSAFSSSTVLVIVSDAKTANAPMAVEQLELASKKAKRIIWLNPLPEKQWQALTNIELLRKYTLMLDCSTLEKLSAACRHIATALVAKIPSTQ